ncbi:ABC transporter ATP-binding protein [Christiangramia fulva]|uniref:ABC transporter ATP-binding protein n=1 Tax=Christiangramia fulva TaxID=2126553 RepID=A0A2R3Z9D3_9FLAO|nr:ABC transporter ATP-binding protein [Christiangramia fulva]AVR46893.1 ABC transporter ATP-binding protein [Christiangramia fulva]
MINKQTFKKNFFYFNFFYDYLGLRLFIDVFLSIILGLLDGLGIAMFIPLIQLSLGIESGVEVNNYLDRFLNFISIELSLKNVFFLILIIFSLKGILRFMEITYRVYLQQFFMRKLRFEHLDLFNTYDYQKFSVADTGRIQNSFTGEINRINGAYKQYFKSLHYFALVVVYVLLAIRTAWIFSLLVLLGGLLMNFVFSYIYKRTKYFSKKYTQESHHFQGLLMQAINHFQYLKATGLNRTFGKRIKDRVKILEKYQKKLGISEAILSGLREPLIIIIVFGAIFTFIHFSERPVATIMLSLILLYRAITFFMAMQEQWNFFLGNSGSISNIIHFRKELKNNQESSGDIVFKSFDDKIELKAVSFSYEKKRPVLKDIDLVISKNEIVAIVGESGAGKTTLMNILSGIITPDSGRFIVDGEPMKNLDLISFRKKTGYIVQDPVIFNDSVFNNISFWKEKNNASLDRFWKAAEKAAIDSYIKSLPYKEETLLGYNGINISGGQKQRFSIARELFKETEILFMDEATSSLDSETENEIQNNLISLKGKYTMIIIAHRLSTVKFADKIIVLKDGRIESSGTYAELMSKSKEFQRMVRYQSL